MRKRYRRLVVTMAVLVSACGRHAPDANRVNCIHPVAGCRFDLAGETVVVRFSEQPRPMRPFVLEVNAARAIAVDADFSMPDMEMLPNRYQLTRTADGRWQTSVMLPVCVSGRADWLLALRVGDAQASVPFSTGN
ncbi:MAG: hypothetical protein JNK68_03305 [Betaproteobacteria bacterium]|nr:hypothetical protein [Betaproteobacteria bacterium]